MDDGGRGRRCFCLVVPFFWGDPCRSFRPSTVSVGKIELVVKEGERLTFIWHLAPAVDLPRLDFKTKTHKGHPSKPLFALLTWLRS